MDERAEVGLLTRNIVVQGDSATSAGGFGGHIMGMGGTLRVEGVELHFMGQKGLMARYPMHWHLMGAGGRPVLRGKQRVEELQPLRDRARDQQRPGRGQCLLRQPGPRLLPGGRQPRRATCSRGTSASGPTSTTEGVLPTDASAATFWITNPDNTIRDNVAAGSEAFGFWYALPASPTGLSTGSPLLPRLTPLREFSGNVAHSNQRRGLNVDDGPLPDGTTETTFYSPRTDPNDANTAVVADFTNFTAYKHRARAVWIRGGTSG